MLKVIDHLTTKEFEKDSDGHIYFFDNLKFWLILLIVIAGFTYPIEHVNTFYKGMGMFVATVPMPIFNFVAGYFAKGIIDPDTGRFKFEKLIQTLILYLFMSLSVYLIEHFLLNSVEPYKFFEPANPEWYLLSCVAWYGLIPILFSLKPRYVIIGSVLLALFIGMDPMVGDFMALSRTICFFPFFIIAYYLSQENIEKILNYGGNITRVLALAFIMGFLVFCIFDTWDYSQWKQLVSANCPYVSIAALGDMYNLKGCLARLIWYVGIMAIIFAIMLIVPRSKTSYSNIGKKTLQIFILHTIAVKFMIYLGLYEFVESSSLYFAIFMHILISVALVLLFSLKPFQAPYNLVVGWNLDFLTRDKT